MNYTFAGVLTEKEVKQHLLHPFEVPAQAMGLEIVLQFSPARVNNISNMLCLTLFDPLGFRGAGQRKRWSVAGEVRSDLRHCAWRRWFHRLLPDGFRGPARLLWSKPPGEQDIRLARNATV